MELPKHLLRSFAEITNDKTDNNEGTAYGTVVMSNTNDIFVRLDGSNELMPVANSIAVNDGDRVIVTIKNHNSTITGNISSPPAANICTDEWKDSNSNNCKYISSGIDIAAKINDSETSQDSSDVAQVKMGVKIHNSGHENIVRETSIDIKDGSIDVLVPSENTVKINGHRILTDEDNLNTDGPTNEIDGSQVEALKAEVNAVKAEVDTLSGTVTDAKAEVNVVKAEVVEEAKIAANNVLLDKEDKSNKTGSFNAPLVMGVYHYLFKKPDEEVERYPDLKLFIDNIHRNNSINIPLYDGCYFTTENETSHISGEIRTNGYDGYKYALFPIENYLMYRIRSYGASASERAIIFLNENMEILEHFGKKYIDRFYYIIDNVVYIYKYNSEQTNLVSDEYKTMSETPKYIIANSYNPNNIEFEVPSVEIVNESIWHYIDRKFQEMQM